MIHFWELSENRNYIKLEKEFNNYMIRKLKKEGYPYKLRKKFENKVSIRIIKRLSKELKISLDLFEKNIVWIGGVNSKGLSNPKLPFNLSNREGTRFISSIVNDGCITKKDKKSQGRLMYDNFDKSLRDSVIKDYMKVFGGKKEEVSFRKNKNKKYLEFKSVIRDIMEIILKKKGPKTESNLEVPSFILKKKENMLGWIEQTIGDEGEVKFYPKKYRRSIVWRRSLDITALINKKIIKPISLRKLSKNLQSLVQKQKCELIEGEKQMLDILGIKYKVYNLGIYPTTKGKIRTRWQINISQRENLMKLRKLIQIPSKGKDNKFKNLFKGFKRYKEPLKIKTTIMEIGKNNRTFTSRDLKERLQYKRIGNSNIWLKRFEREGIVKKVKESTYGDGDYRKPAEYKLTLNR